MAADQDFDDFDDDDDEEEEEQQHSQTGIAPMRVNGDARALERMATQRRITSRTKRCRSVIDTHYHTC